MNADQFQLVESIFERACAIPLEEQIAFVEKQCRNNTEVRRKVIGMLKVEREETLAFSPAESIDAVDERAAEYGGSNIRRFGRYTILRLLGRGGMGEVFLAEQDKPKRTVALKAIRSELSNSHIRRRFEWETEVLGRLIHPGIAHVYDAGVADVGLGPQPFFAMEYIQGNALCAYAQARGLDTRQRLELFKKVCDAVHYAHLKGVIHRDLKPANILVDDSGQPKVLDFGIAIATDAEARMTTLRTDVGQLVGTLPYMSPEQVAADPNGLDIRSDVYSLGVCLYELLVGRLPYDIGDKMIHEAARMVREDEPTSLSALDQSLSGDVDTIVRKALEKERSRRYQSAAELAEDIRRYLSDQPVIARPPSTFYQIGKFVRRNRALVIATGVAAAVLVLASIASTWWAIKANRAREAESYQRRLADEAANRARASEMQMRQQAYSSAISAALAMADNDPVQARELLDRSPADIRGWEWRYLSQRVGRPLLSLASPAEAAWRADGVPIAAQVQDQTVRFINMRTMETIRELDVNDIHGAAFLSPGAKYCVIRAGQDQGSVCDVSSGELLYTFGGWSEATYVHFSPDESLFCILGRRRTEIIMRDSCTGRSRWALKLPSHFYRMMPLSDRVHARVLASGHVAIVNLYSGELSEAWTSESDHSYYATNPQGTLRAEWAIGPTRNFLVVRSTRSGEKLYEWDIHTGGVTSVLFSPSGRYLASNGFDEKTRIWDLVDGRKLADVSIGICSQMAFSQDESEVLVSSDQGAFVLRCRQRPPARVLDHHTSYVYQVVYNPDGSLIASAGWDQAVRVWDARSGKPIRTLPLPSHFIGALGFNDDGTRLIAVGNSKHWEQGNVIVWNVTTGERTSESRILVSEDSGETLRPRTPEDDAFYWEFARGGSKATRFNGGEFAATSHDRSLFATASAGEVLVAEREHGRKLRRFFGNRDLVRAVAFSHDDALLASGGNDHTVRVWDVETGEQLAVMTGHTDHVYTVAFSPDGTRIASGGNDHTIRLWDTGTFEQLIVLTGHDGYVHSLAFSPDGSQLASGSGDGDVRLWDSVRTERPREAP